MDDMTPLIIKISAILLAFIMIVGALTIVFIKTNGKVSRGHFGMFLLGFMCLCVAVDWVPAEISFGGDKKITFTSRVKEAEREAIIARAELSKEFMAPMITGDIDE